MADFLELRSVCKRFGREPVLREVSLALAAEQTLSVLGASGSGKTTLLKIIAGLEAQDSGEVHLAGARLDGLPPERRGVVYLYQEPLLFPHLDVFENVAFGLRLRRTPRAELERRTGALLEELGLAEHARKRPPQLSGGQRQRAAFGRALIVEPRLLLLDEPFGALDAGTRAAMQDLFRRVARAQRIAALFVTHDLKEALVVGDCFAQLAHGGLAQYSDREAFLRDPASGAGEEIRFWSELRRSE
jgi:putrescine transport system ATP-binding protein